MEEERVKNFNIRIGVYLFAVEPRLVENRLGYYTVFGNYKRKY